MSTPGQRIDELIEQIEYHRQKYYVEDSPVISDAEYDALRRRYERLAERFPQMRPENGPETQVGFAPAEGFAKVRHARPMLSLSNAFDDDDVREFDKRVRRFLSLGAEDPLELVAEPKIDGLSAALR